MSHIIRKPAFCICKIKVADQLHSSVPLFFSYIDSTISILPKSEISNLTVFSSCTAHFVYDLVRNPKGRFSHDAAFKKVVMRKSVLKFPNSEDSNKPARLQRLARGYVTKLSQRC